ncbi:MAG: hypothetical protein V3T86_02920 [Planctomycetota bacterium]
MVPEVQAHPDRVVTTQSTQSELGLCMFSFFDTSADCALQVRVLAFERMQEEVRADTLKHIREHGDEIRDALTSDVLNLDSRTKPQSARVLASTAASLARKAVGCK